MAKPTTGTWHIRTESGSDYTLDLDRMLCMRGRRSGEEHELRRDGEAVPIFRVITLEPGRGMDLLLDIRGDGIETLRRTTPIVTMNATES